MMQTQANSQVLGRTFLSALFIELALDPDDIYVISIMYVSPEAVRLSWQQPVFCMRYLLLTIAIRA